MTADKAMKRVNKITEQVVGQTEVEEKVHVIFQIYSSY